jgi:hypothetical protein
MPSIEEMQRAWELRVNEQAADLAILDAIVETLIVNMLISRPNGALLLQDTERQVLDLLKQRIADAKFQGAAILRAQSWFQTASARLSQTTDSSKH